MRIVLLSKNPRLYSTRRLVEAATQLGHEMLVLDPLQISLVLGGDGPDVIYAGEIEAEALRNASPSVAALLGGVIRFLVYAWGVISFWLLFLYLPDLGLLGAAGYVVLTIMTAVGVSEPARLVPALNQLDALRSRINSAM